MRIRSFGRAQELPNRTGPNVSQPLQEVSTVLVIFENGFALYTQPKLAKVTRLMAFFLCENPPFKKTCQVDF